MFPGNGNRIRGAVCISLGNELAVGGLINDAVSHKTVHGSEGDNVADYSIITGKVCIYISDRARLQHRLHGT